MKPVMGLLILISTIVGCQSSTKPESNGAMHWQRTEMYFGQTRRDGSEITDRDWKEFLNEEIVPKFPSGLTVFDGDGRWRDTNGLIHTEGSRVLVVLYPMDDSEADGKLDAIAQKYCADFDQEAVMRLDSDEALSFIKPK